MLLPAMLPALLALRPSAARRHLYGFDDHGPCGMGGLEHSCGNTKYGSVKNFRQVDPATAASVVLWQPGGPVTAPGIAESYTLTVDGDTLYYISITGTSAADAAVWLVACDLLSGVPRFTAPLPFDLLPPPSAAVRGQQRRGRLGAGPGPLTGATIAVDPDTKQVFVGGYTQTNVTMVPDSRCQPPCGSDAVCCSDPWHTAAAGECFTVGNCSDISWLAGDPLLSVVRLSAEGGNAKTITSVATPGLEIKASACACACMPHQPARGITRVPCFCRASQHFGVQTFSNVYHFCACVAMARRRRRHAVYAGQQLVSLHRRGGPAHVQVHLKRAVAFNIFMKKTDHLPRQARDKHEER